MLKIFLVIICFCLFNCIQLSYSQQTICSSYEQNIEFLGNDLSFTYDAHTAIGYFSFFETRFLPYFIIFNFNSKN